MSTDTIPQSWVDFVKEVNSSGEKAVVVSERVQRSVRGRADLVKVLEADVLWNGELVVGPSLTACKDSLNGVTVPETRRVRLPERMDLPPAALAAQSIDKLRGFATLAELEAAGLDFTSLVRVCLDWSGEKRSTKSVVKALAEAFQASGEVDGEVVSRYSQAVEMLAFASAIGPLLEPDRLLRVVKLASETPTAYRPVAAPHDLSSTLKSVVGRYSQERRERILTDLWKVSHQRRWWDLKRKDRLDNPYYRRNRQDQEDVYNIAHQQRLQAQQAAEEKAARVAQVWVDGKLRLPAKVAEASFWADPENRQVVVYLLESMESVVAQHGQVAFDELLKASKHFPDLKEYGTWLMEKHLEALKEVPDHNPQGRPWLHASHISTVYGRGDSQNYESYTHGYPLLLLGLQASLPRASKASLEAFTRRVVPYGNLASEFWPLVPDSVFDAIVGTFKGNYGGYYWRQTASSLAACSEERRGRTFDLLASNMKAKVDLAVAGVCSQEQFDKLLSRATLDRRVKLMRSPLAPEAELDATMEILFAQDAQGSEVISFMSANADKVPQEKFEQIHRSLPPSKRALLLSEMSSTMLREVLSRGLEKDDTVLAHALKLRVAHLRLLAYKGGDDEKIQIEELEDVSMLTERIVSWRACEEALDALHQNRRLLLSVDDADLVRIVRQADSNEKVSEILRGSETDEDLVLGLEVWAAALAMGVSLAGTATADAAIAAGRVPIEALQGMWRSDDPDDKVSIAHSPTLPPGERPTSSIEALAQMLVRDTKDVATEEWPEKPGSWADLVPQAGTKRYPMPESVRALHGKPMEGLEGSKVTMLRSPLELHRNAEHMGNCTFGYDSYHQAGRMFIGHLATRDGAEYNFALQPTMNHYGPAVGPWRVGEINSRFNRGRVPTEVREAITKLAASLK